MKVDVRQAGDVIIVDLDADLVAGVGDELLSQVMNELLAENWKRILLNLSKVSQIDSCGVGEIVAGIKLAERFGSSVKLVNVGRKVRDILDLTRILPLLDIHEDEAHALEAFTA